MYAPKIAEDVKLETLFASERLTPATVYYNGQSITNSAIMIDTKDYEEAYVSLNFGTVTGAVASILNSIYESDTNDPTAATLLSGASFTARNDANDETIAEANVKCQGTKRYLALVTETQGAPGTIDFGAQMLLTPRSRPTSKTLEFDV